MKNIYLRLSLVISACLPLMAFTWLQMRDALGDEKSIAVEAMLKQVFPGTTPVWGNYLSVQDGAQKQTRIAVTDVAKISSGPSSTFIAGFQEFDAGDKNIELLHKGIPPTDAGSHAVLAAVVKNSSGAFGPVTSSVLEPGHAFSSVTNLYSRPANAPGVIVIYETIDLLQEQSVTIDWNAVFDSNLKLIQQSPVGVAVKDAGKKDAVRLLQIRRTATGIVIEDYQAARNIPMSCPAICAPTIQQLLGN
jgi:hypothetical protein